MRSVVMIKKYLPGILVSLIIAGVSLAINNVLPVDLIGMALIALLLGMLLNPLLHKYDVLDSGIDWSAKYILRTRSEEHTSELQSRPHLVCRLLLEKKKKKAMYITLSM